MRKASWFSLVSWTCAALAAAAVLVSPASAALAPPEPVMPADGVVLEALPAFGWNGVSGAARYEWEISADPGFNSPVLGLNYDHFFTRNGRATLTKTVPDGSYWWHVRAVTANGDVGPWSPAQSFEKRWAEVRLEPTLLAPADGGDVTYPTDVFKLSWTAVPGAAKYLVSVATDPALGSLVWTGNAKETQATSFTPGLQLAPDQTYYWGVTPVDAEGNHGAPSAVHSFTWRWNSTTTTARTDIASEAQIYDWRFSWDPVPGAAGYELEVGTSEDFAPGSRVCCEVIGGTKVTTIGTSYSPKVALQNNTYYWRVRAVDPSRNAGLWNVGQSFFKSFNNVPPSVEHLRMLDNPFPAEGPFETSVPIVTWDPIPGASSYEVEVTRYAPLGCNWGATTEHWRSVTASTAWTPLGNGWNNQKPYGSPLSVSWDIPSLVLGHSYCVRVTALDRPSDVISPTIRSTETYLPGPGTPAFTWTGPAAGGPCTAPCNVNSLGAGDYLTPVTGTVTASMPVFRWKPLEGFESYFVLVSKDPDFTNLIDYAFTQVAAYAPRLTFGPKTYPDENNDTLYYWAVLPATERNGDGVTTAPSFSAPRSFQKRSPAPQLIAPADGAVFAGAVTFQWKPVLGARYYRLQVSKDPSFGSAIVEEISTDSTSFTSSKTYDADTKLYWRVRADAESTDQPSSVVGLTWSNQGPSPDLRSFRKTLAKPVPSAGNPTIGTDLPVWRWSTVPGAVSYDFQLELPNKTPSLFTGLPSSAAAPILMKGTGSWHWQVRANFPQVDTTVVTHGPWSDKQAFTRTIPEPPNPTEDVGPGRVLLRWGPRLGALNYRVQISTRPDFSVGVETTTTDNTSYAPLLTSYYYLQGGTFYWRVAAADDIVANVGDFTAARTFTVAPSSGTTTSKLATTLSAAVTKTSAKVKVTGALFPSLPGKTIAVTLYRKRSGVYRAIATKRPLLSSLSRYATAFARPRPGYCRVTARFAGDTTHKASSKRVNFRC